MQKFTIRAQTLIFLVLLFVHFHSCLYRVFVCKYCTAKLHYNELLICMSKNSLLGVFVIEEQFLLLIIFLENVAKFGCIADFRIEKFRTCSVRCLFKRKHSRKISSNPLFLPSFCQELWIRGRIASLPNYIQLKTESTKYIRWCISQWIYICKMSIICQPIVQQKRMSTRCAYCLYINNHLLHINRAVE